MSTPEIEFGPIPVLSDVTKQIELSNESLIPAKFSCEMVSNCYFQKNTVCHCILHANTLHWADVSKRSNEKDLN